MSKDDYIAKLMKNPKYDSGWIDKAATLMEKYNMSEDFLAKFSAEKLAIIEQANAKYDKSNPDGEDGLFIDLICNPKLNVSQMQILLTARSQGVDTMKLMRIAREEIPYGIMNYVAQAMVDGLDLTEDYNIMDFDIDQIYEIIAGYHSGIDYRTYADPRIPAFSMSVIRVGLEVGYAIRFDVDDRSITMELPRAKAIELERVE